MILETPTVEPLVIFIMLSSFLDSPGLSFQGYSQGKNLYYISI